MNIAKTFQIQYIMKHENIPLSRFDKIKEIHIVWEIYASNREQVGKEEKDKEEEEDTNSHEEM